MSKLQNGIFSALTCLLVAAVVYLGIQVVDLKSQLVGWTPDTQNSTEIDDVLEQLTELKTLVETQEQTLAALKVDWHGQLATLEEKVHNTYLPRQPEYSLSTQIYSPMGNTNTIIGDKQKLATWMQNNQIYLDNIVKESLVLSYNNRYKRVVVDQVIPGSVFAQMGLQNGDVIAAVDGKVINRGEVLRSALLNPKATTVNIIRSDNRLALNLKYIDESRPDKKLIPGLAFKEVKIQKTQVNNKPGVKITKISPTYPVKPLKTNDVVLSVNGVNLDSSNFYKEVEEQLLNAIDQKSKVEFEIIRNGKKAVEEVAFSNDK